MLNIQDDISDTELKQRWRLYWIHCIFEYSNIKLQRMSWIEADEDAWPNREIWESSYEQCYSAYFDNLALDDAYEKALKSRNVSKEEALEANKFHQLSYLYIEPSEDPEEILRDIQWLEVVESAKEFWNFLKNSVQSQREIKLINTLEKDFL
ncbi:hypothetical protein JHD50_05955 [Sulfurimonas sp. MAG313]|nr:hypothetical protein [Sulfurimonas sp. MAG313]MDF1880853.1 hypothetical protein [Sulfurimonas sp. MAG313]